MAYNPILCTETGQCRADKYNRLLPTTSTEQDRRKHYMHFKLSLPTTCSRTFSSNAARITIVCNVFRFWTYVASFRRYSRSKSEVVQNWPKFRMFLAPFFFLGGGANFWTCIIKFSQVLIMWQSFRAIGWGTLENAWRKKRKNERKHHGQNRRPPVLPYGPPNNPFSASVYKTFTKLLSCSHLKECITKPVLVACLHAFALNAIFVV